MEDEHSPSGGLHEGLAPAQGSGGLAVRVGPGLDPALAGLALAQGSGGLAVRA